MWEYEETNAEPGLHRQNWPLTRSGGGVVRAGEYVVVLNVDGREFAQKLVVENDPHADPKALITTPERLDYLEKERREQKDGKTEDDD